MGQVAVFLTAVGTGRSGRQVALLGLGVLGEGLGPPGLPCKCCQVHGCGTCLHTHVFSSAEGNLEIIWVHLFF